MGTHKVETSHCLIVFITIQICNINHKLVFLFDNSLELTTLDYENLINLCKDYDIYIVSLNKNINSNSIKSDNVKVINFYKEEKTIMMPDNIHLNDKGNKVLASILKDTIYN